MTALQQAGFCILGVLVSYIVLVHLEAKISKYRTAKQKSDGACGACVFSLIAWIAIFLLLPK